jgi:hypothetical protein
MSGELSHFKFRRMRESIRILSSVVPVYGRVFAAGDHLGSWIFFFFIMSAFAMMPNLDLSQWDPIQLLNDRNTFIIKLPGSN